MSAMREELHHLVDELSDDQVPETLALLRIRQDGGERPWPPPWFGAGEGRRSDTAERAEEILRTEFGRSA